MSDPKFKSALLSASDQALAAGTISKHDHQTLQAVTQSPDLTFLTAIQFLVAHTLGLVGSATGAIDWASLIAAIKTILPLIMQIIALFKPTPVPVPPPAPPSPVTPTGSAPPQGSAP